MISIPVFEDALDKILAYWLSYTPDQEKGGFYGRIHPDNRVEPGAPKGSVLNARILWTFSAASRQARNTQGWGEKREAYLVAAKRAFEYIKACFIDPTYGGVYWSVDADGHPLDTKKQVYALAFTIYGLTEYYAATGDPAALGTAVSLYHDIENHSHDPRGGGYLEAFSRDWGEAGDVRLSEKDANEKKTMNTHLHILEAYANLYRYWKDPRLNQQIVRLLRVFQEHLVDPVSCHLILFLDENWRPKSRTISFGHDIEASWLLQEAAEICGYQPAAFRELAVGMVDAALEGLSPEGALYYEYEPATGHWRKEKHWWVEAEAMVGLVNAWEISGEDEYYASFERVWAYIDRYVIDHKDGEWLWGLTELNLPMAGQDKVGTWKCPYHNSRALMEIIRRLEGRPQ